MAKPAIKKPPRHLSHYTTLSGLKGIIDTNSIWASNASFLNDKAELVHALKSSRKALRLLSSRRALDEWEPLIAKAFSELESVTNSQSYVSCFCDNDDNLSQWRGYGGSIQGVCINFDRVKLSRRLHADGARLHSVVYTKISTAAKLRDALDRELQDIADIDDLIGGADESERYADLLSRISRLLPRFKHLGFKDEKEWRYVVQKVEEEAVSEFRIIGNKIIPYIVLGLKSGKLPITSVRVGPGADQELTARSVEGFMKAKGYDVDVRVSDVPYRP